jgi:acetyl-CoA carboxylase, biotin carboxylase subunit
MQKILVANRGEIALRVMRTARKMGIKTVAVYSDIDAGMPFVQFADEAFHIGPSPSNQSYLLGNKIIEVAVACGADGIHPGYGFLSENAAFSEAVEKAGITFIGPSKFSIDTMGGKISAKQAAAKFNVPMVPGTDSALKDLAEAKEVAAKTGFPLLIKASAGGGGKGMRIVENEGELEQQMNSAKTEALNSFGDESVFIEKYVASPKHIEIQVLGDKHGNYVHLFERECSIQRRHQKLIEEAPSSCLTPAVRAAMGKCAIDVAKSCNYSGAGTVEFLVDNDLNFYFLEMNTRLQVEHCVTEMITGIDLVEQQIYAARGEKLSFTQDDLTITGHAIELRVCAEDPYNNFAPDMGTLKIYERPTGDGIRVDDGYEQGIDIPIFYDPMIAKLIAHADTRNEAIAKLTTAINNFRIIGIETTLPFGKWAIHEKAFVDGKFDTHFIANYFSPEKMDAHTDLGAKAAAALAVHALQAANGKMPLADTVASDWWSGRR